MKIIAAIDSMKGSLSSEEANSIIETAFNDEEILVEKVTIADGGEGTVNAFVSNAKGEILQSVCHDLSGRMIEADIGWLANKKTAIIESAKSCGIQFLDNNTQTHPRNTNSSGLGEQILSAHRMGAKQIIIGLGGTGTIDCGIGMLASLGVKFFDKKGQIVSPYPKNFSIIESFSIADIPEELNQLKFLVASDVQTPVSGDSGVVHMFGEQKGLEVNEKDVYEEDVFGFSQLLLNGSNSEPGDGAAGGIALALRIILNAKNYSGIELVAQYASLEQKIKHSDLVITGEGKIDYQSLQGKVPVGIAALAKKHHVPIIAFVGEMVGDPIEFEEVGISVIVPIVNRVSTLESAIVNAKQNLLSAAIRVKQLLFLLT